MKILDTDECANKPLAKIKFEKFMIMLFILYLMYERDYIYG